MLTGTGLARLGDVERYLRAAAQRLERLPSRVAVDRERMATIHGLEARPPDVATRCGSSRRCASPSSPQAHVRPGATVKRVREALAVG